MAMQGISLRELSRRTNVPQHTLSDWFQRGWLKDYFVGFSGRSALHSEDAADFILHWRKSKSSKEETMANLFDSTVEDENLRTADESIPNDEIVANNDELDSAQVVTIDVTASVVTLDDRANKIRQLSFNVAHDIIEIGLELIAAKQEVGHGGWSDWLKKEFAWSQRTANNFMRVAERFGKLENVCQFKPSTLQTMLALPEGSEEEFIEEQAAGGKPIQNQSARQLDQSIKEFKAKTTPANHSLNGNSTIEDEVAGTYQNLIGKPANDAVVDELNALAANHDYLEDKCPQAKNTVLDKCPQRVAVDTSGEDNAPDSFKLLAELETLTGYRERRCRTDGCADSSVQQFTELKIDDEFSQILPPLKDYEFKLLEENILHDGITNPLTVWNGIIVDGHARYQIAKRHNLPFKIREVTFKDRNDAIIWIVDNQFGRRDLVEYERLTMVLKLEKSYAGATAVE